MRHPFETLQYMMDEGPSFRSPLHTLTCVLIVIAVFAPQLLEAQRHKWSVTGSAGLAVLNLASVDDDNAADAEGWAEQGIPLSPFSSLRQGLLLSGRVSYKYDREFALSLQVLSSSKTVAASYRGSNAELDLERGVSSTDVALGVAYYPSLRPDFLEWYMHANFGLTFASATAKAWGITYVKIAGVPTPEPLVDTDAVFRKTKTSVGAGLGMDIPLWAGFTINAEALYRFAQVGMMDGDVVRFGESGSATTTIVFNYSGFLLSTGIRVEL